MWVISWGSTNQATVPFIFSPLLCLVLGAGNPGNLIPILFLPSLLRKVTPYVRSILYTKNESFLIWASVHIAQNRKESHKFSTATESTDKSNWNINRSEKIYLPLPQKKRFTEIEALILCAVIVFLRGRKQKRVILYAKSCPPSCIQLDLRKADKPYQKWAVVVAQMDPCVSQQLLATNTALIFKNFAV